MSEVIITYGEGWISKKEGNQVSTGYFSVFQVDEKFIRDFVAPEELNQEWFSKWIKPKH